uniref:Uncharacterized protein n=1 Tax=Bionectria ochroleuca TaxID=29856 RepID=A0A8H7K5I5_BIOOC
MAAHGRPDAKRRKTGSGFAPKPSGPSPAPDSPRAGPSHAYEGTKLGTLPGTRPTRILLGHWSKSNEENIENQHAVYGILGRNDVFRVKLVRETRDGRYVDGNFPAAPGALWVAYDEVIMEPHLRLLARPEIKEYCRVRQYQIDQGETSEEKEKNEVKAAKEAQARVGGNSAIIKHTAVTSVTDTSDNVVEPQSCKQRGPSGLRISRRIEAKTLAESKAQAGQDKMDRDESHVNGRSHHSLGGIKGLNSRVNNTRLEGTVSHLECTAATVAEKESAVATTAVTAPCRFAASGDMQRQNQVRESLKVRAASECAKVYDGLKFERKSTGPFAGKLVARGRSSISMERDYVEYRVLTRPSLL